ncbi:helix-turn-helix transcriptional regulator [Cellulomonas endophytica]|uniref:helix-turn-helix transcriptional regulator n=1 Tax=Cellulomonas endophytica TaxID=2494735 RepID=UPI00101278F1|nr:WYL domain-containing protein [Cellulomonas endophytica]
MRADRLVATLLVLQRRGRVTAGELAAELEVSVATARRDLEALSTAGLPVYAVQGRGGGWALLGGGRTDLSGLSAPEVRALFLLLGPAARADPGVRSALRKLVRALPEAFRAEAEAAGRALVVDAARWGAGPARPGGPSEPRAEEPAEERAEAGAAAGPAPGGGTGVVAALQEALARERAVTFGYTDARGRTGRRSADPWALVDKAGTPYLLAGTTRGRRLLRVDRVRDVVVTDAPSRRPPDAEVRAAWAEAAAEVEALRSRVVAQVRVDPAALGPLGDVLGRQHVVPGEALPDGRRAAAVSADTVPMLARQLAGWWDVVEVVGPPEVRAALAAIGAALVERNG